MAGEKSLYLGRYTNNLLLLSATISSPAWLTLVNELTCQFFFSNQSGAKYVAVSSYICLRNPELVCFPFPSLPYCLYRVRISYTKQ